MSVRGISSPFGGVFPTSGQVRTCSSAVRHSRPKGPCVRLTCVRHAASVDPEPGSNSSKDGEAAEQASTIDRAVPGVVDWERRLLHTSVGKVPATQKRVGYRKDSRLDCGCHHVQASAPEREMVSLSTRASIPGALSFGKEPGVPVLVLYRLRWCTRRSLTTNESIPDHSPLGKELALSLATTAPRRSTYNPGRS